MPECSGLLHDVTDIVFEDEQVRVTLAGNPDERMVVILDRSNHFFPVFQFHQNRGGALDQALEVFGFLKGLFRGACGFSLL
jgi:hypothetical protein